MEFTVNMSSTLLLDWSSFYNHNNLADANKTKKKLRFLRKKGKVPYTNDLRSLRGPCLDQSTRTIISI